MIYVSLISNSIETLKGCNLDIVSCRIHARKSTPKVLEPEAISWSNLRRYASSNMCLNETVNG